MNRLLFRTIAALLLITPAIGMGPAAGEAAELRMLFRDKPPYSYRENGEDKGFLLERTRMILEKAGVNARFEQSPPKRLFAEIEANETAVCSFGWYKIASRELFAGFSRPIHQDRPHLLLATPEAAARLRAAGSLKALATDRSLVLATVGGVSYGPELDAWIAGFAGRIDRALISPLQVAQKLAAGRADFMFIDQDDLEYLLSTDKGFEQQGLQPVVFPDAPAGLKRYILCSRKVPDTTLRRINTAIDNHVKLEASEKRIR